MAMRSLLKRLRPKHRLIFRRHYVDTPSTARDNRETIEEAARNLRYAWFRELLESGEADAVATAHTLDDQAETVLQKLLRGAWTEGLGGIHPVITCSQGMILRPFLGTHRAEIESMVSVRSASLGVKTPRMPRHIHS